jgi:hypothetical protein
VFRRTRPRAVRMQAWSPSDATQPTAAQAGEEDEDLGEVVIVFGASAARSPSRNATRACVRPALR